MIQLFYKLIPHECKYTLTDVLFCAYKDGYGRLLQEQELTPIKWELMKDIQPRCIHCGKMQAPFVYPESSSK